MKRLLLITGGIIGVTVLLLASRLLFVLLRQPPPQPLPLPDNLIALDSEQGQAMLRESTFRVDYGGLKQAVVTQKRLAWCGVASSVMILNALCPNQPLRTQDRFFDGDVATVRSSWQVTFGGMTLNEFGRLVAAHGPDTETVFADEQSLDGFREQARQNLVRPGDFIAVNYQRGALGQKRSGHIAPVAAYHAATDRVLLLDVATYKYPHVWVKIEDLWNGMIEEDTTSRRSRGYLEIRGTCR